MLTAYVIAAFAVAGANASNGAVYTQLFLAMGSVIRLFEFRWYSRKIKKHVARSEELRKRIDDLECGLTDPKGDD